MPETKTDKKDVHAGAFFGPACQFLKAANQLLGADAGSGTFTRPIYFLYAHAIELALKSFLRAHGLSIVEGQSARRHHRLTELYEECKTLGMRIGPDDLTNFGNVVSLLEGANEDQGLRYFTMKSSSFPDLGWTRDAVEQLMRVVEPHVAASDKAAGIKNDVPVVLNITWSQPRATQK